MFRGQGYTHLSGRVPAGLVPGARVSYQTLSYHLNRMSEPLKALFPQLLGRSCRKGDNRRVGHRGLDAGGDLQGQEPCRQGCQGDRRQGTIAPPRTGAAVSCVREPVEAFFNWLNEQTNIQRTHKCRFTAGLLVQVMGCIAIAFT